jgi:methionine sulfoxide reductase heme-binding subunit
MHRKWLSWAAHVGALVPLAWLIWDYTQGHLTFNPIQDITLRTGEAALILLLLSLACTPLNTLFGWRQVLPLRRPLGLYAAGYAALHLLTFVGLDYGFDIGAIGKTIAEKRYIMAGLASFVLLLALAITSTRGWMKRLGKNWKRLHRLVYLAALLAVLHFIWLVKADLTEPLIYATLLGVLLVVRIPPITRSITSFRTKQKRT